MSDQTTPQLLDHELRIAKLERELSILRASRRDARLLDPHVGGVRMRPKLLASSVSERAARLRDQFLEESGEVALEALNQACRCLAARTDAAARPAGPPGLICGSAALTNDDEEDQ